MSALARLKRILAETLVRSGIDTTDDIMILNAFFNDFRWDERRASAAGLSAMWEAALSCPPPGHFLGLTLHFPYCREKCLFCLHPSRVPPTKRHIQSFLEQIQEEAAFYARVFHGGSFRTFMAGGGTPSLLSEEDLARLFGPIFENFRFEDDAYLSVECNPASTDAGKLKVLRRLGFKRVSFGVQSLDPGVLSAVRRGYQRAEMVEDAVRGALAAGFENLNLDLVFGLMGDTTETFLDSFQTVARLRPTTITVCGLTLTDGYMRAMKITREEYCRHYAAVLPAALAGLRRLGSEAGYTIDELTPERGIWVLVAQGTPRGILESEFHHKEQGPHPSSILGLGDGSRSHVFGRALYMRESGPFGPDAAIYRLAPLTAKEEMAKYLVYSIANDSIIRPAEFRARFGVDIDDAFRLEFRALSAMGALRAESGGFRFLPKEPHLRVFYGLVLLLDTARRLPFSFGSIDDGFLAALREELQEAVLPG